MNPNKIIPAILFFTLVLIVSPPAPCGDFSLSFEGVILTKGTTSSRTAGIDKPSVFIPTEKNGSGYDDALWRFFAGVRFSAGF
jgi:hypothetical protein